jgi:hypothetical protein
VDGVPVGPPLATPSLPVARGEQEIAVGRFSNSAYFVGDIDEVNLFNYAWSAEDVAAHYEGMRVRQKSGGS